MPVGTHGLYATKEVPMLKMLPLLLAVLFTAAHASTSVFAQRLVTNEDATRLGLQRSWFAQVRVDPSIGKVVDWVLDKDQLFALSNAGAIQALDAETGETLWTTELGVGHQAAAGMAVNAKYVALLGASRLYLLDRTDGQHIWSRKVGGAASAAPALSENFAFVVLLSGLIEGYRLDDPTAYVWQYQSHGRTFESPVTTGEVVSWPSTSGHLYVAQANPPRVLFRVETNDEIVTAPAEQSPFLYVASLDGYLYCFNEFSGSEEWRYATGFPITSQPAIVADKAFVASEGPSLHAVNALTGLPLWDVEGAAQFVAIGKQHTYGLDRFGTLLVLDNETGGIAGRLATGQGTHALVNDQSDRILLVNDRGTVQCLHEIGADEPTWHRVVQEEKVAAEQAVPDPDAATPTTEAADDYSDEPEEDTDESPFESEETDDEADVGFGDF